MQWFDSQRGWHLNARDRQSLRVGISIFVRKGEQSLWENGIFQNCLFLVLLLLKAPNVSAAFLVFGGGDGDAADARRFMSDSPVPLIDMPAALESIDVMIEMSAQLSREWSDSFCAKGGKIVSMRVGNDYVIDIERMLFGKDPGMLITGAPYHEVWTLPEFERTGQRYYEAALRAPVRLMPHLWSPLVLDKAVAGLPAGQKFGYQSGKPQWRMGIFEPNICMVKTSFIPMLVVEVAYRAKPQWIQNLRVFNSYHMKEHGNFVGFANSLDVVKNGLATFEGRFPIFHSLSNDVDSLVCHHWENGQNYLYYEALYGGYPLVHNSTFLSDCGYYYPDFDCEQGGLALLQAFMQHDADLANYRRNANAFLQTLDPQSIDNVKTYSQALANLYGAV